MRDINFLTWNTQLYEMGNKLSKNSPVKQIDTQIFDGVVEEVKDFLDKKTNAVAILQEIPFKCNTDSFNTHKLFTKFIEIFPEKKYSMLYNVSSKNQIKMTVVLAKKTGQEELIYKKENGLNNNMCVSFGIKDSDLFIVGVHPHNAKELYNWLQKWDLPDVMLGDFNAGDYKKKSESDEFKNNREYYHKLMEEYTDTCDGKNTRKIIYHNGYEYETPIDHILVRKNSEFAKKYEYCNASVDLSIDLSDHYPIYFALSYIDNDLK